MMRGRSEKRTIEDVSLPVLVGLGNPVPAKLNLFFEVLGKRSDGYHDIETFVTPIDLYDTLSFTPGDEGPIGFSCQRMRGSLGTAPPK